jgi:hypothetical protein
MKHSRPIHCSFCLEEGHHIHRCKDTSISLLNEEIEEIAAMDWRLDLSSGFIRNKLSTLTLPELKVLGYRHTVPNMSKINEDALINELSNIFLENTNTHRYIIENMNHIFKEIKVDSDNLKSYNNPNLPVMPELISSITQYINSI